MNNLWLLEWQLANLLINWSDPGNETAFAFTTSTLAATIGPRTSLRCESFCVARKLSAVEILLLRHVLSLSSRWFWPRRCRIPQKTASCCLRYWTSNTSDEYGQYLLQKYKFKLIEKHLQLFRKQIKIARWPLFFFSPRLRSILVFLFSSALRALRLPLLAAFVLVIGAFLRRA